MLGISLDAQKDASAATVAAPTAAGPIVNWYRPTETGAAAAASPIRASAVVVVVTGMTAEPYGAAYPVGTVLDALAVEPNRTTFFPSGRHR